MTSGMIDIILSIIDYSTERKLENNNKIHLPSENIQPQRSKLTQINEQKILHSKTGIGEQSIGN